MSYVDNIRTFVRVFELSSMSAAARDLRISPAVASGRIGALEEHLGVRLFNRTTRRLQPTEHGRMFYKGANRIIDAIERAEAEIASYTKNPRGSIYVAAPLGVGKRFIAPGVPVFKDKYPDIDVRLRMTDRKIDWTGEALDIAFVLGPLEDSTLRLRTIAECPRVLCAAPSYIEKRGFPQNGPDLLKQHHDCLRFLYPQAAEDQWALDTPNGPLKFSVDGPFESDDGDVLTGWALDGRGIVNKPVFEVAEYLKAGSLVQVAPDTPPTPVYLACLYPHKKFQDPKIRLFIEFISDLCKKQLVELQSATQVASA